MGIEYIYKTPRIKLNEQLFERLAIAAKDYNMSPYYFAKLIVVKFMANRIGVEVTELLKSEKATAVAEIEDLTCAEETYSILGNGLTDVFWHNMQRHADKHGMLMEEYFIYILIRYLEDTTYPNLNEDLKHAYKLVPQNQDNKESNDRDSEEDSQGLYLDELF